MATDIEENTTYIAYCVDCQEELEMYSLADAELWCDDHDSNFHSSPEGTERERFQEAMDVAYQSVRRTFE